MTGRGKGGRTDPDPAVKARAEALFQRKQEQKREGEAAMGDYLAKGEAERTNMVKLREMRLATEAKTAGQRLSKRSENRRQGEALVILYPLNHVGTFLSLPAP